MKSRMKFKNLYAEYTDSNSLIFGMKNQDYIDCHESGVIWNSITLYGIPKNLNDDQMFRFYEGDISDLVKIGDISGYLILCREMNRRGEDPWQICDDLDGDIEYAMSVLSKTGAPLDFEISDPDQNVYYIQEVNMVSEFKDDLKLKSLILNQLPDLIFAFLHVTPDLVVYYPTKLEPAQEVVTDERYHVLQQIANQKMTTTMNKIFSSDHDTNENPKSNVSSFGDAFEFSDEEYDVLYGKDTDPPYPEEEKDEDEFALFELNGFEEIGESRLLCLQVE